MQKTLAVLFGGLFCLVASGFAQTAAGPSAALEDLLKKVLAATGDERSSDARKARDY